MSCRLKHGNGIELVGAGSWNVAQVLADDSDTWSHGEAKFDHVLSQFSNGRLLSGENGPLQASLYIERSWQDCTWLQQIILRAGSEDILMRNWLHWRGQRRLVKLAFTLAADKTSGRRDVPFGAFPCPANGYEFPLQMWMDISGEGKNGQEVGLALLNDGKYGADVNGPTMRLTILRCPPYAYDRIHTLGSKARYDWVDQGPQEFTLVLRPHLDDWRDAGIVQRARELNLPIQPVTMYSHGGALPPKNSLAALDSDEIEMTAVKPAHDGNGYILRLADRHGRGGSGRLTWQNASFNVSVAPYEVITLLLEQRDGHWRMTPCDMLERPAHDSR